MNDRLRAVATVWMLTLALAVLMVRWADADFLRAEAARGWTAPNAGQDRLRPIYRPYRRVQNAWVWVCVAATAGMAALVALDGRWRRPWPAGPIIVLVAFAVGVILAAGYLVTAPPIARQNGVRSGLHDTLSTRVLGAILGAWAVAWGRPVDWRGRLVTAMWGAEAGLLIGYGVLFG